MRAAGSAGRALCPVSALTCLWTSGLVRPISHAIARSISRAVGTTSLTGPRRRRSPQGTPRRIAFEILLYTDLQRADATGHTDIKEVRTYFAAADKKKAAKSAITKQYGAA